MTRLLDYVKANTHLTQLKKAREAMRATGSVSPRLDKRIENLEILLSGKEGQA